jgi:hypothetical protein
MANSLDRRNGVDASIRLLHDMNQRGSSFANEWLRSTRPFSTSRATIEGVQTGKYPCLKKYAGECRR